MRALRATDETLLLRTDFADDAAWSSLVAVVQRPVGEFRAYVTPVSDAQFRDVTVEEIVAMTEGADLTFLLVADRRALMEPESPLLVIDRSEERGRSFRVIPSEVWGVENNLSLGNMDFGEFADATDDDGVFRGFRE